MKKKDQKKREKVVQPVAHEEGEHHLQDEYHELVEFLKAHGSRLGTAILLALIIAGGLRLFFIHRTRVNQQASAQLANARSVQELESMVNKYKSAPSVSVAKLRLAKAYYSTGNYDAALKIYAELMKKYHDDTIAPAAVMGNAHCLEARGLTDQALKAYKTFADDNPGSFLYFDAVLGQARCMEQLGRVREAGNLMEEYIAGHPGSAWQTVADEFLKKIKRKLAFNGADTPHQPAALQPVTATNASPSTPLAAIPENVTN